MRVRSIRWKRHEQSMLDVQEREDILAGLLCGGAKVDICYFMFTDTVIWRVYWAETVDA